MADNLRSIIDELEKGLSQEDCKKCGCMRDLLESLHASLPHRKEKEASELLKRVEEWRSVLGEKEYSCLGCEHCYPATASNAIGELFPDIEIRDSCCSFEVTAGWPPVPGEYHVLSCDPSSNIAVSTLASINLSDTLAKLAPKGLAIVGKTSTENIGIDKIIKNVVTNPAIRYLIVCGEDSKGHLSGQTLLALSKNGTDDKMRVVGSPGKKPILKNVTKDEVEAFRRQVEVIDLIGTLDPQLVSQKVSDLASNHLPTNANSTICSIVQSPPPKNAVVYAKPHVDAKLDKAGYFVILPQDNGTIYVEHYSNDDELLRTIKGSNARDIYLTVIDNGWTTELNHAAYLGKELTMAEMSIKKRFRYVQDKA